MGRMAFATVTFGALGPVSGLANYIAREKGSAASATALIVSVVVIAIWARFAYARATNLGIATFRATAYVALIVVVGVFGVGIFSFPLPWVLVSTLILQLPLFLLPGEK